jgi:hypothetical protein
VHYFHLGDIAIGEARLLVMFVLLLQVIDHSSESLCNFSSFFKDLHPLDYWDTLLLQMLSVTGIIFAEKQSYTV